MIKTRADLERIAPNVSSWLRSNNKELLDKFFPRKTKGWSHQSVFESAKKFTSKTQWIKKFSGAYKYAQIHGIVDKCTEHMVFERKENTLERCVEVARRYKTRNEWSKKDGSTYNTARIRGWFPQCTVHMDEVRNTYNREMVLEIASKYKSMTRFKKQWVGAYEYAFRHGMLPQLRKIMGIKYGV